MTRKQLGREVAKNSRVPAATAQDVVDEMVAEILRRLRDREPVNIEELEREANGKLKALAGGK
jgi:nucleoid DNA-binding protein